MRSSMPTAARRRARSRSRRFRATCSPQSRVAARCARRLGHADACAQARGAMRCGSPSGSRPRSGVRRSKPTRWRSTARSSRARCAPRMPGRCCSPASRAPDRARLVAQGLLSPRFFSGWGIRTVARGEARYNPMSYHNGSIWPHDNALIALGFARYGLNRAVATVSKGLFDAATYMDLRRLPELFCGFQRERRRGPTLYPVACAPQAWASATPFSLVQASLGLEFAPDSDEIRLRNPVPAAVPRRDHAAQSAARRVASAISRCAGTATKFRSSRCARAAKFRSRWSFRD